MNNGKSIKLVIIGGDNSGKTKFMQYLMGQNIDINSYIPTIGSQFCSKQIKFYQQKIELDIWDTAGQERYGPLIKIFIKESCLIFLFYNSTDKSSFERAKTKFNIAKDCCDINKAVYVLVSSKYDLSKNIQKVSEEEALEFATNNNMLFAHISIVEKYGNGINELFDKALKEYFKRKKFIK